MEQAPANQSNGTLHKVMLNADGNFTVDGEPMSIHDMSALIANDEQVQFELMIETSKSGHAHINSYFDFQRTVGTNWNRISVVHKRNKETVE